MWLLVLGIVLLAGLLALLYLYLNSRNRWNDTQMVKKKYFFKQQICKVANVSKFVSEIVQEIMKIKGVQAALTQKTQNLYTCEVAILYQDSSKYIAKYGECLIGVGLLFAHDVDTAPFEPEFSSLGYVKKDIKFSRGFARVLPNPHRGIQNYICQGIMMCGEFDKFLSRNKDIREAADLQDEAWIEFVEIINPELVVYYRPVFNCKDYMLRDIPQELSSLFYSSAL